MKKFKPGVSFSDFVIRDSMVKRIRGMDEEKGLNFRRGWLIWITVLTVLGLLVMRLAYLQVFYGERYRLLSDENRIKKIVLSAPRGRIVDRNGAELAGNTKVAEIRNDELWEGWRREYPLKESTAPITGYLGEVGEKEVGLLKEVGGKYAGGDLIGRGGLEFEYEKILRGVDGGRLVEIDSNGKIVREMGRKEPVQGVELKLGIDAVLQTTAFEAMGSKKGAVVASDPRTGEIRILVSTPSYDPNSNVARMLDDKNLPMFNRAVTGTYPPGSTFKIITASAAISEGKADAGFTYQDMGVIRVGNFSYTNWLYNRSGGVEGVVGFVKAIARSTDTFFYRIGEMTGPEIMGKWAKLLGLGGRTGIDLPGEAEGLIPSPEWKLREIGERWFLGNTYHMAIGQGDVLATPLQINLMTNVIANGGRRCKQHLVIGKPQCGDVPISLDALRIIKQGLVEACSPGGTAFPLFGFVPQVACKTGTAEYVAENGKVRTHGWLTAYAPADNPEISVTVLVEGGGEGSNVAAPVVRKILAKYFGVADNYNYAAIPQEVGE